jgi:hypothetical protein
VTGSWNTGSIGGGLSPLRGPSGAPRVMGEPPLSPPTSAAVSPPPPPPLQGTSLHPVHAEPPAPAPVAAAPTDGAESSLETLLLRFRLITPDQLDEAQRLKQETGRDIGALVVERGWATEDQLSRLLSYAPALAPEEPAPAPAQPAEPVAQEPAQYWATDAQTDPALTVVPAPALEPAFEAAPERVAEQMTEAVAEQQPAFEPQPAPELQAVAIVEPALQPVGLVEPTPEPQPTFVAPEPIVEQHVQAEPVAEQTPAPAPEVGARVFVRLTTGERLEVGMYGDLDSARARGAAVVRELMAAGTDWPVFGGRFLRPDAVVSVDIEPTV